MLHKQNSCHHIGSSCLQIFLVIFLVYLTRGSSNRAPAIALFQSCGQAAGNIGASFSGNGLEGGVIHFSAERTGIGNDLLLLLLGTNELVAAGYPADLGMAGIDSLCRSKSPAHHLLIRRKRGHIKSRHLTNGSAPEMQIKIVLDGIPADDQITNVQLGT